MAKQDLLVGFIGLGTMGGKMAANLQKAGYRLVVHDLTRQAASHHLNAGAMWADSPRKDAAWFDLSTNSPSVVKKLNAAFAEKGAHMLDAPVSGGPAGAASGKLAIWVGGEKSAFDKYKAVLDAMGDKAAYIGPIGAATVAKLVHNMSS